MINETFRMLCPSWSPRPRCVCYKAVSPWTWSGPRNHQRPVTAKLDRAGLTKSGRCLSCLLSGCPFSFILLEDKPLVL